MSVALESGLSSPVSVAVVCVGVLVAGVHLDLELGYGAGHASGQGRGRRGRAGDLQVQSDAAGGDLQLQEAVTYVIFTLRYFCH